MRTFARPVNKGIRLDYFVCSSGMFAKDNTTSSTTSVESETTTTESSEVSNGTTTAVQAKRRLVSAQDIPTPGVYDSYSLPEDTVGCSDHAPVVLVVKV
jgi:exonuclease III